MDDLFAEFENDIDVVLEKKRKCLECGDAMPKNAPSYHKKCMSCFKLGLNKQPKEINVSNFTGKPCQDCQNPLPIDAPDWKTRCRSCYLAHRETLALVQCKICKKEFKAEEWKTFCAPCFRAMKEKERNRNY